MLRKALKRTGIGLGVLVVLLALLVTTLYVYPLGSDRATNPKVTALPFAQAKAAAEVAVQQDTAKGDVRPECRTKLLTHPDRPAKSVLMLHGYTSCPEDYDELAELFYRQGYNVYAPREAHHGLTNKQATADVSVDGLLDYADSGLDIAAGLGQEVGVIGISGGADLATWLAEYRTESVAHLLALSPFYQPGPKQAPGIVVRPITVLYGYHLVPDKINERGFSFSALTQYLRIVHNYRDRPVNDKLRSVAVVTSANDDLIDLRRAVEVPRGIAENSGVPLLSHEFPSALGFEHAILDQENLGTRAAAINTYYLDLYEGRGSTPPV
ncbi:alpha/beta hydrolase [Kribbella sp. NPDC056861]|uniref:alpha/beta hydrolase n=1 Tax=Kribbella sp. NPDC056861 TaxID=3154857 RepID=UPI0034429B7E